MYNNTPVDIKSFVLNMLSKKYSIPTIDSIFNAVEVSDNFVSLQDFKVTTSERLETQLYNFGMAAKIVNVNVGPVIVRFELALADGVSIKKFSKLADDLAITFRTHSIRIVAPIPGTSLVGIEIPNPFATIIPIQEILKSNEFLNPDKILPIALGKTTDNNPFVIDIAKAPHILISGCTGSGKSICINTILASLLLTKHPNDLKLILIDPKIVELQTYNKAPHLLKPVVTDPAEALKTFEFLVGEIDERYRKMAVVGARNIESYNDKVPEKLAMPYIVTVVDEFADLMLVSRKALENYIVRIAQKARAAGIHLILATQRPSVKIITGLIKANFPTRIAFKASSQVDSKIILDKIGAEKLLGNGDMLFKGYGSDEPIRIHGSFISDIEISKLTNNFN
jgi:S-DNA-T family DNA segregation ATPase FtsK/SpoIIIE